MGHAIQNSRALLTALQENDRELEMVHFCVGPYNTTKDEKGENCAILIGELEASIMCLLGQKNIFKTSMFFLFLFFSLLPFDKLQE